MADTVKVYAAVSYEERHQAKSRGFRWDRREKQWWKEVTPEEAQSLPFRVYRWEERPLTKDPGPDPDDYPRETSDG